MTAACGCPIMLAGTCHAWGCAAGLDTWSRQEQEWCEADHEGGLHVRCGGVDVGGRCVADTCEVRT